MSGVFEFVRWNACVHRLDLGLYSYLKEYLGNGVRTHVNSKGKIPCTERFQVGLNLGYIVQDSKRSTLLTELFGTLLQAVVDHTFFSVCRDVFTAVVLLYSLQHMVQKENKAEIHCHAIHSVLQSMFIAV